MKALYWFSGIVTATMFVIAAVFNTQIREAVYVLSVAILTLALGWVGYQFVAFCSGYKARLFEASHSEAEL